MVRPALGFGWLLWRRGRLAFAFALASAALTFAIGQTPFAPYALPVGSVYFSLAVFALLAALTFADAADVASLASGYPKYLLLLPVRTATLALWPMILGSLAVATAWVTFAVVALGPHFGPGAVLVSTLGLVAMLTALQAIAWVPLPVPYVRSLLVLASLGGLVLWGVLAIEGQVAPALTGMGYAGSVALAFRAATRGLARARRGETVEWKRAPRVRKVAEESSKARPFRSPMEAQVWIESRRNGLAMPLVSAFAALLYVLPTVLAHSRPPVAHGALEYDPSLVLYLVAPLLIAVLAGFDGGCASVRDNFREDFSLVPLLATRPLSDAGLVEAKLRMLVGAVARSAAILALGPALLLLSPLRVGGASTTVGAYVLAHATTQEVNLAVLVAAFLPVYAWRSAVGGLWLNLSHRSWLRHGVGIGLTSALLLACPFVWLRSQNDPAFPAFLARLAPPTLVMLVVLKTIATLLVTVRVRRLGLVPARILVRWPLVGFVGWVLVFLAFRGVAPSLPLTPIQLALILFLLVPLVRVQLAVLILHDNRHR